MNAIIIFLAMSLDIGGVGGLLSGMLVRSFRRMLLWAAGFGVLNVVLGLFIQGDPNFVYIPIALFWGLVGWFAKRVAQMVAVKIITR